MYEMNLLNGKLYLNGELVKGLRSYNIEHDELYDSPGTAKLTLELNVTTGANGDTKGEQAILTG